MAIWHSALLCKQSARFLHTASNGTIMDVRTHDCLYDLLHDCFSGFFSIFTAKPIHKIPGHRMRLLLPSRNCRLYGLSWLFLDYDWLWIHAAAWSRISKNLSIHLQAKKTNKCCTKASGIKDIGKWSTCQPIHLNTYNLRVALYLILFYDLLK